MEGNVHSVFIPQEYNLKVSHYNKSITKTVKRLHGKNKKLMCFLSVRAGVVRSLWFLITILSNMTTEYTTINNYFTTKKVASQM